MRTGPTSPATAGRDRRARSGRTAIVLGLLLPALFVSAAPGHAGAQVAWQDVLERARTTSRQTAHHGEMLIATFGTAHHTQIVEVSANGRASTTTMPDERSVRLSPRGGELSDPSEGYTLQLPPATAHAAAPVRLEAKYDVDVVGSDVLLGRPCTLLDVRTRAGTLRESLWVDDSAGLLLRRETYDDDKLVRLALYLRLDLEETPSAPSPVATPPAFPLEERAQGVTAVDARGLQALAAAGWQVPDELPGGYAADGTYVVSGETASPLQLVYSDGLYTVSLFQQAGEPAPGSLPAGAEQVTDAAGAAWVWTDAVPSRRVWEASGTTWTLVTDAPSTDVQAILAALPQHREPGLLDRLRAGAARLWSWVSPWS